MRGADLGGEWVLWSEESGKKRLVSKEHAQVDV